MKKILKIFIPAFFLQAYHLLLAHLAAWWYRYPSRRMTIIGVTGTKGKTSTAYFIWSALNAAGWKTGMIGTTSISIGEVAQLNPYHMTMPGRFTLQRFLARMEKAHCRAVVVETSSQGIAQSRHRGVIYDMLVFTNLTPEHIELHGSFEQYRALKQKIFRELARSERKIINGREIPKVIIAAADSAESINFLSFPADKKITYGTSANADVRATHIKNTIRGVSFSVERHKIKLQTPGTFNAVNALPALIVSDLLGLHKKKIIQGIETIPTIPGRMEVIAERPFAVIVDYAYEPASMEAVFRSIRSFVGKNGKTSVVFGAAGGGRDKLKRPTMGSLAAQYADYVILTTDDPYDEDPATIIEQIARGVHRTSKREGSVILKILDRRLAICKAMSLAKEDDLVLILGMGAEQSMVVGKKRVPWDDRIVAREELEKLKHS